MSVMQFSCFGIRRGGLKNCLKRGGNLKSRKKNFFESILIDLSNMFLGDSNPIFENVKIINLEKY